MAEEETSTPTEGSGFVIENQDNLADVMESSADGAVKTSDIETGGQEVAKANIAEAEQVKETETEQKPKHKSKAQDRIRGLVSEKKALKEELARLKAEQSHEKEPNIDDFESYDDYVEAEKAYNSAEPKDVEVEVAKAGVEATIEELEIKFDDVRDKYADFDELVKKPIEDGGPVVTIAMIEAINDVDNAGDIAYFLATNVKESEKIAKLSTIKQAVEIAKLSVKFDNTKPSYEVASVSRTKAPEPINALGGGDALHKSVAEASSFNEYAHLREQENQSSNGW